MGEATARLPEDGLRRDVAALEHRADVADTRAGLLLAVAGLLASLDSEGWPPLAVSARFFAGVAALCAISALSIPVAKLDAVTRQETDSASEYAAAGEAMRLKVARLRLASRFVTAALAFAVLGVTVEAVALGWTE